MESLNSPLQDTMTGYREATGATQRGCSCTAAVFTLYKHIVALFLVTHKGGEVGRINLLIASVCNCLALRETLQWMGMEGKAAEGTVAGKRAR